MGLFSFLQKKKEDDETGVLPQEIYQASTLS
jgi:hypothetical protein